MQYYALHWIAMLRIAMQCIGLCCIATHSIALLRKAMHSVAMQGYAMHSSASWAMHSMVLHCIALQAKLCMQAYAAAAAFFLVQRSKLRWVIRFANDWSTWYTVLCVPIPSDKWKTEHVWECCKLFSNENTQVLDNCTHFNTNKT